MTTTRTSHQSSATDSSVPIIDISGYFEGAMAEKRKIARQIDEACRNIGFLVITGHGVSSDLIERTQQVSRAFFDLPAARQQDVINFLRSL